jgi:phage gp16-like protein
MNTSDVLKTDLGPDQSVMAVINESGDKKTVFQVTSVDVHGTITLSRDLPWAAQSGGAFVIDPLS